MIQCSPAAALVSHQGQMWQNNFPSLRVSPHLSTGGTPGSFNESSKRRGHVLPKPLQQELFQNGNRAAKWKASPHHHVLKECQQSCYFSPQITEHTLGGSGLGEGEIPKTISTTKGLVSTPWAEDLFYCVVSSSHLTAGPQHPHGLPYHAQIQVLLSLSSLQSSGPRHLLHPPQLVHLFS